VIGLLIFLGLGLIWSWKAAGALLLIWAALEFFAFMLD
jgi:hypothetical protein